MDYIKVYNDIISKAKSEGRIRSVQTYYEAHHIVPRCLGGTGNFREYKTHSNIVLLTAREHFICHWLLHRMYPTNGKLTLAFSMMCNVENNNQSRYTPSSRLIEYAKIEMAKVKRSFKHTDEAKKKIAEAGKQRKQTQETIAKRVATRRAGDNYVRSEESRKRDSESKKGIKHSEERKKRMSESNTQRWSKLSQDERKNIFKSVKGKPKPIVECPHCAMIGGISAMQRWHFNNCKNKII